MAGQVSRRFVNASASSSYHALDIVQDAPGKEQANGISCDQPPERIAGNAKLGDVAALALDYVQFLLDLQTHALAAALDAVVGEGAAVSFRHEDVDVVGGVLCAEGLGDRGHVVWVAP
jgi:hypothetical protein